MPIRQCRSVPLLFAYTIRHYFSWQGSNIRIFNGCEVQIENSVMRVSVWHYSTCQLMPHNYLEQRNFQVAPSNHYWLFSCIPSLTIGPRQANLLLIAYASSEGSGEPAHPRSLARTFAARSYKQWVKRNLQTESQIPGPSEWLGMRS